ncbi:MAG: CBS domain-containing protein [Cytophagaceae bacterium]|jgi:CBS domain containing-hemolysin-like protein|nr:CBS domain-containing protein [Cytophagaceae bacterium]
MPEGSKRSSLSSFLKKFLGSKDSPETQREYVEMLERELEHSTGKLSTYEEKQILRGLVKLGNTTTKQIMRSRMDMASISIDLNYEDVQDYIAKAGFSRLPVYNATIDKIEGVLNIKDLFPFYKKDNSFRWQNLIRPVEFIPENKPVEDLLREFQLKHFHIAIVVDEYGGTSGLITLEDILEEIVGEIQDEHDEETKQYTRLGDNSFLFEAKTPLVDFCKAIDIEFSEIEEVKGESESLGGLLLEINLNMPKTGDIIRYKQFLFTIESADVKRIRTVKVDVLQNEEAIS